MLNTRDVSLIVPEHKEGQPYRVILKHRPTGLQAEGAGTDWNDAKAQAQQLLQASVEASTDA